MSNGWASRWFKDNELDEEDELNMARMNDEWGSGWSGGNGLDDDELSTGDQFWLWATGEKYRIRDFDWSMNKGIGKGNVR